METGVQVGRRGQALGNGGEGAAGQQALREITRDSLTRDFLVASMEHEKLFQCTDGHMSVVLRQTLKDVNLSLEPG